MINLKIMWLLFLFSMIFLSSCERKTDWTFTTTNIDLLVVDGIITNEPKVQEIKLSKPVNNLNQQAMPISGAKVMFSDNLKQINLTESPANSGIYKTSSTFSATAGHLYKLVIVVAGKTYKADVRSIDVSVFQPLTFKKEDQQNNYSISWVANVYDKSENAMFEISLDWSNLPEFKGFPIDQCQKKLYYYTLRTADISQLYAPTKEKITFPSGTTIIEKKYSMTAKHAEFIRSMLSETQWRGGYFDVEQGNVITNISEGGAGFFAVCMVIRVSLKIVNLF